MLPVWQEELDPLVKSGKLKVVGIVQEQHPARTRLYAQWRELSWPILVDSLNLLELKAVPIPVAIDEHGIVRHFGDDPRPYIEAFLSDDFAAPAEPGPRAPVAVDLDALREEAESSGTSGAWRALGDAHVLAGDALLLDIAVDAYRRAVAIDPSDGRSQFRLGVALRKRYESSSRKPGDAQAAVDAWGASLAIDPNQYIWRRRIQQYGPRLDKPYNFYYWVEKAREEIAARGETPVPLPVEPSGSELAPPARSGEGTASGTVDALPNRDPHGKIARDDAGMIQIDSFLAPASVRPGSPVRVRVEFRVDPRRKPYWNNEAGDLAAWFSFPEDWSIGEASLSYPNPTEPETQEPRFIDFEVTPPASATSGTVDIPGYALYYVCENRGGRCALLRNDLSITVTIDESAPPLK